jgi:ubiquinone/menaquinone biosynthesis C-methylase UbiE
MQQFENQATSSDQVFYDQDFTFSRSSHERWMREIKFYFEGYSNTLNSVLKGTAGKVAELGAGSCGLSLCATRLPNVNAVYATDISMSRMKRLMDASAEVIYGDKRKVELVSADFNQELPFDDRSLNVVLFDASLHHSRAIWNLLGECRRVLADDGVLIAQRESYLSMFRAKGQLKKLMGTPEVAAQVSENMYLKEQYEYYLRVNGFDVEFIPRSPSKLKSMLWMLNGKVFTDGILWCRVSKDSVG